MNNKKKFQIKMYVCIYTYVDIIITLGQSANKYILLSSESFSYICFVCK